MAGGEFGRATAASQGSAHTAALGRLMEGEEGVRVEKPAPDLIPWAGKYQ